MDAIEARARHQPLRGPGLRDRRHVDRTAAVVMDSLAPTRPAAAELERPTPTARRLAAASISPNTRRAYSGALRRLGGTAVPGGGPGRRRRAGDRPLGSCRAGVRAHEPGRVDHRRDARRELEDEPDGGALLGRGDRRTRGCGAVPLTLPRGGSPIIPFMGPHPPHQRQVLRALSPRRVVHR